MTPSCDPIGWLERRETWVHTLANLTIRTMVATVGVRGFDAAHV